MFKFVNNRGKLSTISQMLTKAIYSANSKFPLWFSSLLLLSSCTHLLPMLSKHYFMHKTLPVILSYEDSPDPRCI